MGDDNNILNSLINTKSNTYRVPEGYFEYLSDSILLKINSKNNSFSVPENYFTSLSDTILAKIKANDLQNESVSELVNVAPLLLQISKNQVYKVPDEYFNKIHFLAPIIKEVKVVQFVYLKPFLKYAAAAVIVSVIAIGGLFNNISKKESLAMYQQSKKINVTESINQISELELNKVLEEEQLIAYQSTNTNSSLPWGNLDNLEEEMQYVTDEEIDAYFKINNISIN